jgi:protein-S-isoprenylcysteine O-methyltransferase Ste14
MNKSKQVLLLVELALIDLLTALALFIPAGTVAWVAGWAYLILYCGFSVATVLWLLRYSPGLIEERMGAFARNNKPWDKVFVIVLSLLYVAWLIVMPLDAVRFRWSVMPAWLQVAGGVMLLYSFYLLFLVYRENPYLSAVIRIQRERGQTVISTGPYRYVRHPMYSSSLLMLLATTLLLGSFYGILFVAVLTVMLAVRSTFEERELRAGLKGYDDYLARVKYRFIPHVW